MDYTVTDASMDDSPVSQKMGTATEFAEQIDTASNNNRPRRETINKVNAGYDALMHDTQIQRAANAIAEQIKTSSRQASFPTSKTREHNFRTMK